MGAWIESRKVLLLDLDNTLYDWVAFFAPAFRGMCQTLSEMSGLPTSVLYSEFRQIFARHGTVEYTFALQELPSLVAMHPHCSQAELVNTYRAAIDVFQHRRRTYLKPYPHVQQGIQILHRVGYEVYGVTDGRRFQAESRLRQLRLDHYLDGLWCVADHAVPEAKTMASIRRKTEDSYRSDLRSVFILPPGLRKPSTGVLDFVVSSLGIQYESCIFVGDSLAKDVAMAQAAGVYDCWAEYGSRVSALDFGTVVRVTNWPRRAVEDALRPSPDRLRVHPSYSASSFDQVVALALMEPTERPEQAQARRARQLSLLEVGPTIKQTRRA